MKKYTLGLVALIAVIAAIGVTATSSAQSEGHIVWDQDFRNDTLGWFGAGEGGWGSVTHVPAETGFAFLQGRQLDTAFGPISDFDGYRDKWIGTWTAEIDVFLEPRGFIGDGFDYSVAANGSDGNHQRDYIFHVGITEAGVLLVNGSNNTDFQTNPFKLLNENGGNYYTVTAPDWYTLQHVFFDRDGHLAVNLNLIDSSDTIVWTATLEDVADTIEDEVGGNRYSWFTFINREDGLGDGVLIDNHKLTITLLPPPPTPTPTPTATPTPRPKIAPGPPTVSYYTWNTDGCYYIVHFGVRTQIACSPGGPGTYTFPQGIRQPR